MIQIEALKLALDWFKCYADKSMSRNNAEALADEVVDAIEKALAQTQEPDYWLGFGLQAHTEKPFENATPLYTTPPQRTEQEPVAKPYAYEYGRCNADGTYSVVIEKGDLIQTMPAVYNYVRPRNAHKDWPIKELFDRPPQPKQEPEIDLQTRWPMKNWKENKTTPPQRTEKKMVMWPCLIDTANFSKGTVTVVMQCEDYKVSAGTHWLSTSPPKEENT